MREENIVVSILIATYNSEKILGKVLDAIRKQTYPQENIEILIVDGGSTDATKSMARQYGCRILDNPKTEPVNAKLIGMQNAKGKYLLTIDHDEVFENLDSIKVRVDALQKYPQCKVAFCSGYKRPQNYPLLNQYISEFGDPFSLFMYNFSKDYHFYEKTLKKNYQLIYENNEYICISFEKMKKIPIIELCCMGTLIDLDYFREKFSVQCNSAEMIHWFYAMLERGDKECIMSKNDPLVHYSVDSLMAYFPKLKWRICNNVHYAEKGENGFCGRLKYQKRISYKKYLFMLYAIIPPISMIYAIYLAMSRRNPIYLLHPIFCFYVAFQIMWQMCLKLLGITPEFKSYDGKKKIDR